MTKYTTVLVSDLLGTVTCNCPRSWYSHLVIEREMISRRGAENARLENAGHENARKDWLWKADQA